MAPSSAVADLAALGLLHPGAVYANLSPAALVEHSLRRGEGVLTDTGALTATTGAIAARSLRRGRADFRTRDLVGTSQ
jgi:phosphoenolpyruvate carboxykinase (ATP)